MKNLIVIFSLFTLSLLHANEGPRINQIQLKGTHNSYHILKGYSPVDWLPLDTHITDWNYTHAPLSEQLKKQGVRQIELDIHYGNGQYPVYHLAGIDNGTTCADLVSCLVEIRDWSADNPQHEALWLLIEPKDRSDPSDYFEEPISNHFPELENIIESALGTDNIYKPSELRGNYASLRERIQKDGWPTVDKTRGKIILVLNSSDLNKKIYAKSKKRQSELLMLLKASPDELLSSTPPRYDMVYTEVGNPLGNEKYIQTLVKKGFMVRTRADERGLDDPQAKQGNNIRAQAALASGAQIISTDLPARVAETSYFFEIPGGHPARCNPLNAPDSCKPELIEP